VASSAASSLSNIYLIFLDNLGNGVTVAYQIFGYPVDVAEVVSQLTPFWSGCFRAHPTGLLDFLQARDLAARIHGLTPSGPREVNSQTRYQGFEWGARRLSLRDIRGQRPTKEHGIRPKTKGKWCLFSAPLFTGAVRR
jgi:hypothetical protein